MTNKILGKKIQFSTPWFDLVSKTIYNADENKNEEYYSIQANDYVSILALTKNKDIIMVEQYRPSIEDMSLELPAGYVEVNEEPSVSAQRELYEETGYRCSRVQTLGCLVPDTGRLANRQWCFFADDAVFDPSYVSLEKGIKTQLVPRTELKEYITSLKFKHALHIAAIMLAISNNKISLE